jgi:putative transposase
VKAYQADFTVTMLCHMLEVSPSGYYAWCKRPPSARQQTDVLLGDRIEAIYRRSHSTYGRARIHDDLKDEGIRVGGKRVARLMRERGVVGVSRRKGACTTIRDRDAGPAPDLVDRRFVADAPDQLWVADITYVPTWAGFL